MSTSDSEAGDVASRHQGEALKRSPKRWSGETWAIVGTGATIIIFVLGSYLSLSSRLDGLHQYREDRLEIVRQEHRLLLRDLQGSVDDLEDSLKETVEEQESRIRAIEVAQSRVAGQLTVMQNESAGE